jgi:outer membrane protein assembly factor BamB
MKRIPFILGLIALFQSGWSQHAQWRGENRDGHFHEIGLLRNWPEEGPQQLFSVEGIGRGFSMPVGHEGHVYVTGNKDSMDYLSCIDFDGTMKWSVPFAPGWNKSFPDTRTAPTIVNNKAVMISGSGVVACLDAVSGRRLWSVDGFNIFKGRCGAWGIAESPLVVDEKVIYTPGGNKTTMVALDLNTGRTIWTTKSLKDTSAYVAPIVVEYAGKRMIVGVTARYIFGVDASDGSMMWHLRYYDLDRPLFHKWAPVINCVSPIHHNGHIYVTSGYNHVGIMLKLNEEGSNVELVWKDTVMDTHHGGVVLLDGFIYGSNWIDNRKGKWCCIEWETGKIRYEKEWETKGSVIAADNHLYCYEEQRGNLALVKATPENFEVVSSFRVKEGTGPHWAHPAISDGKLFVRHGDVLMAYDIKEKTMINTSSCESEPRTGIRAHEQLKAANNRLHPFSNIQIK